MYINAHTYKDTHLYIQLKFAYIYSNIIFISFLSLFFILNFILINIFNIFLILFLLFFKLYESAFTGDLENTE